MSALAVLGSLILPACTPIGVRIERRQDWETTPGIVADFTRDAFERGEAPYVTVTWRNVTDQELCLPTDLVESAASNRIGFEILDRAGRKLRYPENPGYLVPEIPGRHPIHPGGSLTRRYYVKGPYLPKKGLFPVGAWKLRLLYSYFDCAEGSDRWAETDWQRF